MSPEGIPDDSITKIGVRATKVQSVQIGPVTFVVPPSSVERHCAISAIWIVILVLGAKLHIALDKQNIQQT